MLDCISTSLQLKMHFGEISACSISRIRASKTINKWKLASHNGDNDVHCSGHGRRGMQWTALVWVTLTSWPVHRRYSSVTAQLWPASDGVYVVVVLRRGSLGDPCAAVRQIAPQARSPFNARCRRTRITHMTTIVSVVTWWLKKSTSARATTTVLTEKCNLLPQQRTIWWNKHVDVLLMLIIASLPI